MRTDRGPIASRDGVNGAMAINANALAVIEGDHGSTSANLIRDQKIQLLRVLIQVNYGYAVLFTPSPKNQKMKRKITGWKFACAFAPLLAGLCACASTEAQNTESLLSAAGFRTQTPSTQAQEAMYKRTTPYKLERNTISGEALYSYADKKKGVVYIGGDEAYQRYSQLVLRQSMAEKEHEDPAIQPGTIISGYPEPGT